MQIKIIKEWRNHPVGKVLPMCPDGVANTLIKRGFAEPVEGATTPTKATPPKTPPKQQTKAKRRRKK